MLKVYVGCSLTHAPQEFIDEVERLKQKLEKICHLLRFKGLSEKNIAHDVYKHDIIDCVYQCDLLLAICDYPSTGLGYEIATQAEKKRGAVLAVAHENSKVSKLIIDPRLPGYEFRRYKNLCDDVYAMVIERIK
jgi:hypothetical protein